MPTQTDAEKRAYAKGYAAGRKRTAEEDAKIVELHRAIYSKDRERRDAFFCAALNGLLPQAGWLLGGKKLDSSAMYVQLAKNFADEALNQLKI